VSFFSSAEKLQRENLMFFFFEKKHKKELSKRGSRGDWQERGRE
jgi:hypothetical protein